MIHNWSTELRPVSMLRVRLGAQVVECSQGSSLAFCLPHEFSSSFSLFSFSKPNPTESSHTCTKSYWTLPLLAVAVLATTTNAWPWNCGAKALPPASHDMTLYAHAWQRRPSKRRLRNSIPIRGATGHQRIQRTDVLVRSLIHSPRWIQWQARRHHRSTAAHVGGTARSACDATAAGIQWWMCFIWVLISCTLCVTRESLQLPKACKHSTPMGELVKIRVRTGPITQKAWTEGTAHVNGIAQLSEGIHNPGSYICHSHYTWMHLGQVISPRLPLAGTQG